MINNLDVLAARSAQGIVRTTLASHQEGAEARKEKAKALDVVITKTLGVLQENGVYAALLFLYAGATGTRSITANEARTIIAKHMLDALGAREIVLLNLNPPQDIRHWDAVSAFLTGAVCNDLDTLLLVKQLWEQTLIYARYGAKAEG